MVTNIVNTPAAERKVERVEVEDNSGVGLVVVVLIVLALLAVIVFYGLPLLRNQNQAPADSGTSQINISVPPLTGGQNNGGNPTPGTGNTDSGDYGSTQTQ